MNSSLSKKIGLLAASAMLFFGFVATGASPQKVFPNQPQIGTFLYTGGPATIQNKDGGIFVNARKAPLPSAIRGLAVSDGQIQVGSPANLGGALNVQGTIGAEKYCNTSGTSCKSVQDINDANKNNVVPTGPVIPSGAIIIVESGNCPSGFSPYASAQDRLLKVGASFGQGGTAADHTHTYGYGGYGVGFYGPCWDTWQGQVCQGQAVQINSSAVTTGVNGGEVAALPPYQNVYFCKKN